MKIVHVIPSIITGGAERVAVDLSVELRALGHESHLISLGSGSTNRDLVDRLETGSVPLVSLDKRRGPDATVVAGLRRAIRRIEPDIVHTHLGALKYVLACRLPRHIPIVHTVHNDPPREHATRLLRLLDSRGHRGRVAGVVLSPTFAESFERLYGTPPVAVIPNGIRSIPMPAGVSARCSDSIRTAVSVGRLETQKRPDVLLRAFALARQASSEEIRLLVLGDGSLQQSLRGQVAEAGITSDVEFLGNVTEAKVLQFLHGADLFVMSSDYEGLPLSVIEAMMCGLPVVATRVGAIPDLVIEARTGFLVESGDVYDLGRRMAQVLNDRSMAQQMGEAALRSSTRFDLRSMTIAYENLYEALV